MTENPLHAAPVILWFRSDLRLQDQACVQAAVKTGQPIIPLYIWEETLATRPLGAASKWWLYHSLKALGEDLRSFGSRLIIERGAAQVTLESLANKYRVKTIICSHTFDPAYEEHDLHLQNELKASGLTLNRLNTSLLTEPNQVKTGEGKPFRVFTPYFKALQASGACDVDRLPEKPSTDSWAAPAKWPSSLSIEALGLAPKLTPSGKDWSKGFGARFKPGERGARAALRGFLQHHLRDYDSGRDRPDLDLTSHLSPHLRFGEISPQRILLETDKAVRADNSLSMGAAKFRAELAWRDFSYGLLGQQPRLHEVNFRRDFHTFKWRQDDAGFKAWCRGETGYELVDAGMRELWQTGYMHNRVRMVAASFLIKHLMIDWRRGEQWFWDCLVDADPANNPASWQWVAGCGADAAPYFRVFNPITQAEKFDPQGIYRARYIQGYTHPSTGGIHKTVQKDLFGSGDTSMPSTAYPKPIVDHAFARQRALEAYKQRGQDDHAD
ncbi:cryptochrome/photolyase family protein [Asticcacaulis benevestitus]|uniref:cryptochrome/photolyase family protein n=1 Tax=Asticcacaulis benevestitus TaxID=347481 RepID=UPI000476018A|nr:deoxyribodipyrimidine photo-lyase [Asticcacaulis benevestitus]